MEILNNYDRLPLSSLIKVPKQQRSVEMVHRIIDSAVKVLNTQGSIGFSSESIAQKAEITDASIYQYFANKNMLISAIIERTVIDVESINRGISGIAFRNSNQTIHEILWGAINFLNELARPYQKAIKEILKINPILGDLGVAVFLRRPFYIMCKERLLHQDNRYELVGGDVKIHVICDIMIFTMLNRWTEKSSLISDQEYFESLIEMINSQFRLKDY